MLDVPRLVSVVTLLGVGVNHFLGRQRVSPEADDRENLYRFTVLGFTV
jgi:hypothetical protein